MKRSSNPRTQLPGATRKRALSSAVGFTGTLGALAGNGSPARRVEDLIAGIRSTNESVSTAACNSAAAYGPPAVRPLAFELGSSDFEAARKAKRALYSLVRQTARPGAEPEAAALQGRLVAVLHGRPPLSLAARREIVWLLSEIGTAGAVLPLAQLLTDKDLREDARCALTRLPFPQAVAALKSALANSEENFKYALADSLRSRGEKVEGYPSRKMTPTAPTAVTSKT